MLLGAEEEVLKVGGSVVRLVGLYISSPLSSIHTTAMGSTVLIARFHEFNFSWFYASLNP